MTATNYMKIPTGTDRLGVDEDKDMGFEPRIGLDFSTKRNQSATCGPQSPRGAIRKG